MQPSPQRKIWPQHKTHLEGDELETRCPVCGTNWLLDKALAGYQMRCECGSWVGAPAAKRKAQLPTRRPIKRLAYWFDDDSPSEPVFEVRQADSVGTGGNDRSDRRTSPKHGLDRGLLDIFVLFSVLALPVFVLPGMLHGQQAAGLSLFSSVSTGALILLALARRWKPAHRNLGPTKWRHLAEANLAAYAAAGGIIALSGQIAAGSMLGAGLAPLLEQAGLWAGLGLAALLPAIVEEFAFRGALQGRMTQLFGAHSALVISASAYGLAHGSTLYLPAYLLLGLYLGWLRKRSGSLAAPVLMHFLFNGLLVMGQFFSWQLPL